MRSVGRWAPNPNSIGCLPLRFLLSPFSLLSCPVLSPFSVPWVPGAVGRVLGFRVVSTQSNHGKYFQMRDVWKVLTTQLHILSTLNGAKGRGSRSPNECVCCDGCHCHKGDKQLAWLGVTI